MTRKEFISYFEDEIKSNRMVETPIKDAWNTLFLEGYTQTFLEKLAGYRDEESNENMKQLMHTFFDVREWHYKSPLNNICAMYTCRTEKACKSIERACRALFQSVRVEENNGLFFVSAETRQD